MPRLIGWHKRSQTKSNEAMPRKTRLAAGWGFISLPREHYENIFCEAMRKHIELLPKDVTIITGYSSYLFAFQRV